MSTRHAPFRTAALLLVPMLALAFPPLLLTAQAQSPNQTGDGTMSEAPRFAPGEERSLDQEWLLTLFRPVVGRNPAEKDRRDLTLANFFTHGWTASWTEPEEGPQDAPRFRLLRIQRAFWEREVRLVHRWLLFKDFCVGAGCEFPLTGTDALEGRVWLSTYRDF